MTSYTFVCFLFLEDRITPEDTRDFFSSVHVRKILLRADILRANITDLTTTDYCNLRDYLLMRVILHNGQRASCMFGLTMGATRRALKVGQNEEYGTCMVTSHKTNYRTPASLVFDRQTMDVLELYLRMRQMSPGFQKGLHDSDEYALFITFSKSSKPMSTDAIRRALARIWEEASMILNSNPPPNRYSTLGLNCIVLLVFSCF